MNISAPAEAVHEMERQMRINEDVLRYMSIRVDELEEGPSAMMRNRDREDRPRKPRDDREPESNRSMAEESSTGADESSKEVNEPSEGDKA